MYWIISFSWCVVGTAIFWMSLSAKWRRLDTAKVLTIDTFRVLHPVAPGHKNYLDLKFTLLRHAAAFLISSIIIFFVNSSFLIKLVLFLNILYIWSPVGRYRYRKKYIKEIMNDEAKETVSFLNTLVKDSFCTVVYSVICVVFLYVLYGISLS